MFGISLISRSIFLCASHRKTRRKKESFFFSISLPALPFRAGKLFGQTMRLTIGFHRKSKKGKLCDGSAALEPERVSFTNAGKTVKSPSHGPFFSIADRQLTLRIFPIDCSSTRKKVHWTTPWKTLKVDANLSSIEKWTIIRTR